MELSIRITTESKTLDWVNNYLDDRYDKYIVAEEISKEGKKHFHIHLHVNYTELTQYKRKILNKTLKEDFELEAGQKSQYISEVKTENHQAYILKDGKYKYKAYTAEQIDAYEAMSFNIDDTDKLKKDFKKMLDTIYDDYYFADKKDSLGESYNNPWENELAVITANKILELYGEYKLIFRTSNIRMRLTAIRCRRDAWYRRNTASLIAPVVYDN